MPVKFIIAGTILIMLAIIDAVSLKIPNSLLVILLLSSIVYDLIFEHAKFASGCISFLVMFIIFGGIYYFYGGLGFGDVKLVACISYVAGFMSTIIICFIASLFGLIFFVLLQKFKVEKQSKIPFAPFLAFAYCVVIIVRSIIYEC